MRDDSLSFYDTECKQASSGVISTLGCYAFDTCELHECCDPGGWLSSFYVNQTEFTSVVVSPQDESMESVQVAAVVLFAVLGGCCACGLLITVIVMFRRGRRQQVIMLFCSLLAFPFRHLLTFDCLFFLCVCVCSIQTIRTNVLQGFVVHNPSTVAPYAATNVKPNGAGYPQPTYGATTNHQNQFYK